MRTKFLLIILTVFFNYNSLFAQSWSQISTSGGISPRSNASAIYIPTTNKMVVFGGTTSAGNVNEVWSLNLFTNTWSLIPTTSTLVPSPRATHICMYDSLMNRMLIWSGQGSQLFNDVWAFNFNDSTWTELFPDGNVTGAPLKRYGVATIFDPLNRNLISFAGFTTSGRFDDTWAFDVDGTSWTNKTNLFFPLKRCLTSQSFARDRREMIVFGGQESGNLNDIWSLNTDTYTWTSLNPIVKPLARHFPSNSYCGNGYIAVFGGNSLNQGNSAGALNDFWSFSLDTQTWDTLPQGGFKPSPRYGHTSVYIPSLDKMVIYGGQGTSSLFNETWIYSGISGFLNSVTENKTDVFSLNLYPNPSTTDAEITLVLTNEALVSVQIFNSFGSLVYNGSEQKLQGKNKISINCSGFNSGLYFVTVIADNSKVTKRLIVNK